MRASKDKKRKYLGAGKAGYLDPDDAYFRKNFSKLVREHGGKWIVLADGKLIGIGPREKISALVEKAREILPKATPFIAPIPTEEELECVL